MPPVLDFVEEPREQRLLGLMQWLAAHSSTVLLVLRDGLGLSASGRNLLAQLMPYLVEEARTLTREALAGYGLDG